MNREEAQIYLPFEDEDDLHDAYDEKLFELKQFFLGRFPLTKLINARLTKFEKVEQAYITLGGSVDEIIGLNEVALPEFESIHKVYQWYNLEKNALRLRLSASNSLNEVRRVLEELLRVTVHYASYWRIQIDEGNDPSVKIGVEPNPMDIQAGLNELSELEKLNSKHILTLQDENVLKSEAKRLSLWLNFESNEQSIR